MISNYYSKFCYSNRLNITSWIPYSSNILGPGKRTVIWLQGCRKRCNGCITPQMQKAEQIDLVPVDQLSKLLLNLEDIEGITLLGGEPLLQAPSLSKLIEIIKGELSVVIYTGYLLEELRSWDDPFINKILNNIDILIDGEYQIGLDNNQKWRGSENQKIHFLSNLYKETDYDLWKTGGRENQIIFDSTGKYTVIGIPPREQ